MKIFKSYTYKWWQIGIFKLSLLAFGATIGAFWHEFFGEHLALTLAVAIIAGIYVMYASLKQEG